MSGDDVAALCRRLQRLPAAVSSDVLGEMGLHDQVLSNAIRLVGRSRIVAGPALCVRGEQSAGASMVGFEMDRRLPQGSVAIIATGGWRGSAVIGGNIGLSFKLRGAAAVLTDGGARDTDEFAGIDLPLFCAFTTPLAPKGRWTYTALEEPVELPGQSGRAVVVRPGDIVHGDADGAVIVPRQHLAQVVPDAEELERVEGRIKEALRAGADREKAYADNPRFVHIRKIAG